MVFHLHKLGILVTTASAVRANVQSILDFFRLILITIFELKKNNPIIIYNYFYFISHEHYYIRFSK